MKSDFLLALTQLAAERNLPRETVLAAIEAALVSAYRRDSALDGHNISVKLDPGTGDISVFIIKTVAEEVADPRIEVSLAEARGIKPDAQVGETIPTESISQSAGRIGAQTAKQVVMQRLREAERELVFQEYADKEGEVFSVTIQRIEPRQIIVELGRAEAVMPLTEQSPNERYRLGQKIKVLLQSVGHSTKGPDLVVSRADKKLLFRLFEMEVPEIYSGAVEIMAMAREAGFRSKVAVFARQPGVDPVGSCVGLRGIRIQNIVNELHGEKVDVLEWNKDTRAFIANALSPSQVLRVDINEETHSSVAVVPDRQLSLAIGKEGQNARLAAKLTGWRVDIKSHTDAAAAAPAAPPQAVATTVATVTPLVGKTGVEPPAQPVPPVMAPAEEAVGVAAPVAEVVAEPAPAAEPVVAAAARDGVGLPPRTPDAPAPVPAEDMLLDIALADEELLEDAVEAVREEEPVPVGAQATSLADLPPDIWNVAGLQASESGRIRFAEDIAGLRGGVTARRNRGPIGEDPRTRKRKGKPARRRT